MKHTLTIS
uniref:P.crispum CPRF1 light-inducible protein n=1 Tax=Petroselinum crispum TaxID=4043 RepID=A2NVS7_PETCR|nr:hypothetical protein - parsley [Petroselinum crispum]CAA41450.1 unnamed protein product [Petroselinum crispum]